MKDDFLSYSEYSQTSKAIWSSLNDGNYFELTHSVQREQEMYGSKGMTLLNFLGNHDTPRVCTRLTKPIEHYPLAATFLLTAGGVPCLYYGDEGTLTPSALEYGCVVLTKHLSDAAIVRMLP